MLVTQYVEQPLIESIATTEALQRRRERMAATLLANAANETSRRIALRLAKAWGVDVKRLEAEAVTG